MSSSKLDGEKINRSSDKQRDHRNDDDASAIWPGTTTIPLLNQCQISHFLPLGLFFTLIIIMSDNHHVPGCDIKPWARPASQGYLFTNANVVDVQAGKILKNATVLTRLGKFPSVSNIFAKAPSDGPNNHRL